MERPALILYNTLSKDAGEDERDVLEQVAIVRRALKKLGYVVKTGQVGLDLDRTYRQLRAMQPLFVFNLVETLMNRGEFVYFPAALYQSLGIPFTGSPLIPLFIAANKVRSKSEMRRLGIPTPEWMTLAELHKLRPEKTYLLKPIWEEGSLGLDEENLFSGGDKAFIRELAKKSSDYYFVEEFIDGREFNISILAGESGPEVLPFAEMTFHDFPEGKPKMMGYTAKWKEESFEYQNTRRNFEFTLDPDIYKRMVRICKKCWTGLGLKGYVRVDFRLDRFDQPFAIDINANPCLSGSGGFMAASAKAGYTKTDIIKRIVNHALGWSQNA